MHHRRTFLRAAALLLCLSLLLPTSLAAAPGAGLRAAKTPATQLDEAYTNEIIRLTNVERRQRGLTTLKPLPGLTRAAAVRAAELSLRMDHKRPDGRGPSTAIDEQGVKYISMSENIHCAVYAPGETPDFATPAGAVAAWMASTTGHREAILNPDRQYIGVGVYRQHDGALEWAYTAQLFMLQSIPKQPSLNATSLTLNVGQRFAFRIRNLPAKAKVTWNSSELWAPVSAKGVLTAKQPGTGTVSCKITTDSWEKLLRVKVDIRRPAGMALLARNKVSLPVKDNMHLLLHMDHLEIGSVTFVSSNPRVARVTSQSTVSCRVLGVAPGNVTITALFPGGSAKTTFRVEPDIDPDKMAKQVLSLVNAERKKRGLPSVKTTPALSDAARSRAYEISKRYSHTRPNGKPFYSLLDTKKIPYNITGENIHRLSIYKNQTAQGLMRDWMASPGHKAQILNEGFTHLGVGIFLDNKGNLCAAQVFTG